MMVTLKTLKWNVLVIMWMAIVQKTEVSLAKPQTDEPEKPINTSTYIFLKPGTSYNGKSASTKIESSTAAVSVLITIDNWSRWAMTEPEIQVTCGKRPVNIPEKISPGFSEMIFFEKGPGLTGVCGVLTYHLETPNEEQSYYVQAMWSVPYDLNTYNAYLAVGIANEFLNSSSLFNELYYHNGPFQRVKAGSLAEYGASDLKVKLRGTMQPDTYKPIVSVSVMPAEELDSFQFADKNFAAPRNKLAFQNCVIVFIALLLFDFSS